MQKWNIETKKYEEYKIPSDWFCPLVCNNLEEHINCASCGKIITFGDGYTSQRIHTQYGLGYSICEECRNVELSEELHYSKFSD